MRQNINFHMSSELEPSEEAAGHIYAVCSESDPTKVKGGFTTHECPEEYLDVNYGRTMQPMVTIMIQPVTKGFFGEKILFRALEKYRMKKKREVFEVPHHTVVLRAFDCVRDVFADIAKVDRSYEIDYTVTPVTQHEYRKRDEAIVKKFVRDIIKTVAARVTREERAIMRQRRLKESIQAEVDKRVKTKQDRVAKELETEEVRNRKVTQWFKATFTPSEDKSQMAVRRDVFEDFESRHKEQQISKKTRVDKKVFFKLMLDFFGIENLKSQYKQRCDVFLGWKKVLCNSQEGL